jgi:hypothetical protein
MCILFDEVEFLARSISRSKVVLSFLLLLYLHHGILLRDSFVHQLMITFWAPLDLAFHTNHH